MTSSGSRTSRGRRASARTTAGFSKGQLFFCFMAAFCLLLVLRNADAAVEYMGRGLRLCVDTVIPSLFPFMVISELLVRSGAGEVLGRVFARPMKWLFGLSGAGSTAVVLGSLCGFPMGARTAVGLLDRGEITREECAHLLTFSNNPSSAFLITAVGVSLFGSRQAGVLLYLTVLGSGLLTGLIFRLLLRRHGDGACAHTTCVHTSSGLHPGGVDTFTASVTGAASGMLTVCAYVAFFSTLSGILSAAAFRSAGAIPPTLWALLCGFLELSGGIGEASALPDAGTALVVSAAVAGWSGLSVHCQVMSMCEGRGISFGPYILAKAMQSALCAGVMRLLLCVLPAGRPGASAVSAAALPAVGGLLPAGRVFPPAVTLAAFAVSFLVWLRERAGK